MEFISNKEALEALNRGERVQFHFGEKSIEINKDTNFEDLRWWLGANFTLTLNDVVNGKYSIIKENTDSADSREYFVVFEEHDPIRVKVNWDINIPNNPDHDQILQNWITDNYGPVADYEYWEITICEKHEV